MLFNEKRFFNTELRVKKSTINGIILLILVVSGVILKIYQIEYIIAAEPNIKVNQRIY